MIKNFKLFAQEYLDYFLRIQDLEKCNESSPKIEIIAGLH